ncbi:MAG: hypothetical protein GX640_09775 [Fibrobacter sp.]|nr:hypothetical protein [Fibrobacter sp.]
MNRSSGSNDQLRFLWDESVKKTENAIKISSSTEVHLEPYFAFLEDILPDLLPPGRESSLPEMVFELL